MRARPDNFSGFCCGSLLCSFLFFFFPPSASDNIPKADEIRTLVKDTWDTRMAKLRLSADSFVRQQEAHAKVWRQQGLGSSARGSPEGWEEKSCGFCASPALGVQPGHPLGRHRGKKSAAELLAAFLVSRVSRASNFVAFSLFLAG